MKQEQKSISFVKTTIYTILALMAFAANSVICRLALKDGAIDPGMFTSIRLSSGAIVLILLVFMSKERRQEKSKGSWISAGMLFLYAAAFSYAYVSLETGIGALIIFGVVQITMITSSFISGYRMNGLEWLGIFLALGGFLYLLLPGASAPSLSGFILMTLSGIGWGIYSLRGKNSKHPLVDTAYNFLRALPFLILLFYFLAQESNYSTKGILLALLSGIVTSGIGYTIWYAALKGLNSIQASIVQLLVPVLATIGGVIFVGELISFRLMAASLMILGGILLLIIKRIPPKKKRV
jgi:drug/metabolite transporter (DMT)-like permease